jgi:hypothetical protein
VSRGLVKIVYVFILNGIKASENFRLDFIKSLIKLKEENLLKKYILVYLGKDLHLEDYPWLEVLNFESFLKKYLET